MRYVSASCWSMGFNRIVIYIIEEEYMNLGIIFIILENTEGVVGQQWILSKLIGTLALIVGHFLN